MLSAGLMKSRKCATCGVSCPQAVHPTAHCALQQGGCHHPQRAPLCTSSVCCAQALYLDAMLRIMRVLYSGGCHPMPTWQGVLRCAVLHVGALPGRHAAHRACTAQRQRGRARGRPGYGSRPKCAAAIAAVRAHRAWHSGPGNNWAGGALSSCLSCCWLWPFRAGLLDDGTRPGTARRRSHRSGVGCRTMQMPPAHGLPLQLRAALSVQHMLLLCCAVLLYGV